MKLSTVADQTMPAKQVKKPKVKLIGKDGNVFNLAVLLNKL